MNVLWSEVTASGVNYVNLTHWNTNCEILTQNGMHMLKGQILRKTIAAAAQLVAYIARDDSLNTVIPVPNVANVS